MQIYYVFDTVLLAFSVFNKAFMQHNFIDRTKGRSLSVDSLRMEERRSLTNLERSLLLLRLKTKPSGIIVIETGVWKLILHLADGTEDRRQA